MFVIALVYFIDCMCMHELTVIICEFWDLMQLGARVPTQLQLHSKTQKPHVLFFVIIGV